MFGAVFGEGRLIVGVKAPSVMIRQHHAEVAGERIAVGIAARDVKGRCPGKGKGGAVGGRAKMMVPAKAKLRDDGLTIAGFKQARHPKAKAGGAGQVAVGLA